jgi:hypothetical protein
VNGPRLVVTIAAEDSLGGFVSSREVSARLKPDEMRAVLEAAAAACVEQALASIGWYVNYTKALDYGAPGFPLKANEDDD